MADTVRDFRSKVSIAQKEAGETVYWLTLIRDAELLPPDKTGQIESEAGELQRICRQIVLRTKDSTSR